MATTQTQTADAMSPEVQARLSAFARACRAAARAVAMYPASHPAIRATLDHLVRVSGSITAEGAFRVTVLPDALLVDGATPARAETSVADLATLLHRHAVGMLTLHGASDTDTWRSLLALLARGPEDLRADGGISQLWLRTGGPSIEVAEVDFSEVLRDHVGGEEASLADVLMGYLRGQPGRGVHGSVGHDLVALADRPQDLRKVMGGALGSAGPQAAGGFLELARAVLARTARESPENIEATLRALSKMAGELPASTLAQVLGQRGTAAALVDLEGPSGPTTMDVVDTMSRHLDDQGLANLVTGSIAAEGRATPDLITAFHDLAPDPDRRGRVLGLVDQEVDASGTGQRLTISMWRPAREMLGASADERYVSDEYARELRFARTRPIDVEDTQDDPPERLAAWLDSVSDAALRALDVQLVHDLLITETDLERWKENLAFATGFIDDLTRVGQLDAATRLAEAIAAETGTDGDTERRPFAQQARAKLCTSPVVRHIVPYLRASDPESIRVAKRLYQALGPDIVPALSRVLAREEDPKVRRRLQDVVLEFGAAGRNALEELVGSDDPEIRRTAVYLLREFGAGIALPNLEPLLSDAEPRVQREAIRTIALAGDDRAYVLLLRAINRRIVGRHVLLEELDGLADERAAPFFRYLVLEFDYRSAPKDFYLLAIRALGRFGGLDAIEALRSTLARGAWWMPFRTSALRAAAAGALAAINTPAALDVLRDEIRVGGGRRRAARRAMARHAGAR